MPELPEVETVRRTLEPAFGFTIVKVSASTLPLRGKPIDRRRLTKALLGRRLCAARRLGKYLIVDVLGGHDNLHSLLIHLGMSGRFRLMAADSPKPAHTHLELALERGTDRAVLRYSDPRRFGQVDLVERDEPRNHPALGGLGPDPLVDGVDLAAFALRAKRGNRTAKSVLLDQTVLAGVGNIYASEALWQAQIPPTARTNKLSNKRLQLLADAVSEVLGRALAHGGTSLRDFVDADGHAGDHAAYLWVYDRAGESCYRGTCGGTIRRTILQGRATFHCPMCQRR